MSLDLESESAVQTGNGLSPSHGDYISPPASLLHDLDAYSSRSESPVAGLRMGNDLTLTRITASSHAAQLAYHLNSPECRRDPWNISIPIEVLSNALDKNGNDGNGKPQEEESVLLLQKRAAPPSGYAWDSLKADGASTSFSIHDEQDFIGEPYYRRWNDPPLQTVRDCFDMVRQLLEVRRVLFKLRSSARRLNLS
jgi:hypothetical protein